MTDVVERARRKRATIRTMTTKLLQRIERFVNEEETNSVELEEALSQLSVKEGSLTELDLRIEELTELEELEDEVTGAQEYQERIIAWRHRAKERLREVYGGTRAPRCEPEPTQPNVRAATATVKLPRLNLDKFHGNAENWQEFWNQYETAIHRNSSLTNTDKFSYLRSYMGGSAASAINGLTNTDENYESAISILKARFGRKDLIINAHMNRLLNLTPVIKSSEIEALRRLYDTCEIQVRSLESLGIVTETYGSLLCPVLMKAMPDDLTLEFSRKRDADTEWNVGELLRFLRTEIECRERARMLNKLPTGQPEERTRFKDRTVQEMGKHKYNKPSLATAAALTATSESRCIFCDRTEHHTENCDELSMEERREKLKRQGRCYMCLGKRHLARFCKAKVSCSKCGRRHHKTICNQEPRETKEDAIPAIVTSVSQTTKREGDRDTILLQTACAVVVTSRVRRAVRCLLDGGSQRTFIREDVSRALGLPVVGEETLTLHTFASEKPQILTLRRVRIQLANLQDETQSVEMDALETPIVSGAIINVPGTELRARLRAKGLKLAEVTEANNEEVTELSVLIGGDNYWRVVSGRVDRLGMSLVAIETIFGWCLQGPSAIPLGCNAIAVMQVGMPEEELLSERMKEFWELEALGIENKDATMSATDAEALELVRSQIKIKDGRYEVRLPWRSERGYLADNFGVAKKRFLTLVKRFRSDAGFYDKYRQAIEEQIQEGIIEPVVEEAHATEKYYLPHHAVTREDKVTTKLRIVYDASSHERGQQSLNDCLLSGPNLKPNLLSVLLKFRQHKIAFTADIERAFLQISLSEEDRDAVRFLWLDGPLVREGEPKVREFRMTRVLFGVSSSPLLLAATLRHHFTVCESSYPGLSEVLGESFYVDDLIAGASSTEDAFSMSRDAKTVVGLAKMNLRKWRTHDADLRSLWKENSFNPGEGIHSGLQGGSPLKVLGLVWDTENDEFTFEMSALLDFLIRRRSTKRHVLQASARIYDPIGFLSPLVIRVKCLFQEMWERGIAWDEELPDELQEKWEKWCMELPHVRKIRVSRHYLLGNQPTMDTQLHVFCDASEQAYGAVVYLRFVQEGGERGVTFVTSKARVAPLKRLTLPRLELLAALVGARLVHHAKIILGIGNSNIFMWSDSTITLHWIQGSSRLWKPFVHNRVVEIQTLTEPRRWAHCSGKTNPADLLTRGSHVNELVTGQSWWKGPNWLSKPEEEWPKGSPNQLTETEKNLESRTTSQLICQVENQQEPPTVLMDLARYSSISKVRRITSWIYRFINNTRHPAQRGSLTAGELEVAERYWIRTTQTQSFGEELAELKRGKPICSRSKIANLNPFLDEGCLMRLGGRLEQSNLSFSERHPLILPSDGEFSKLLIQECHERVLHSGLCDTIAQARERFWIIRVRQLAKKTINNCTVCRRYRARPGSESVAPLPRDRTNEAPPFEVSGVDFAGPLYTKGNQKVYIALFTCAVTRALHLELVSNLSTEVFMLALRRFISRRGMIKTLYSDNAKTFKAANRELEKLWRLARTPALQEFFGKEGITWKFIVPKAAWWGGFWERMVGTVKRCLRKVLGRSHLTFEELTTTLTEVEAVINSRPITFTYSEAKEPEPLTPGHFLIGKRLTAVPSTHPRTKQEEPGVTASRVQLLKRWKYRQTLLQGFWKRWRREYLLDLRTANTYPIVRSTHEFKPKDIVLLHEETTPRQLWRLGEVTSVYKGRDDKVRSCDVRFASGAILKRPIQLLYPMEI